MGYKLYPHAKTFKGSPIIFHFSCNLTFSLRLGWIMLSNTTLPSLGVTTFFRNLPIIWQSGSCLGHNDYRALKRFSFTFTRWDFRGKPMSLWTPLAFISVEKIRASVSILYCIVWNCVVVWIYVWQNFVSHKELFVYSS